jgi:hypothetical protein
MGIEGERRELRTRVEREMFLRVTRMGQSKPNVTPDVDQCISYLKNASNEEMGDRERGERRAVVNPRALTVSQ